MRAIVITLLLAMLLASPVFSRGAREAAAEKGPVVLPMLFREGGNDANTRMNKEIIKRFSEKYEGIYEVKIEWVPGMAEEYRQKLKMLNSPGSLPVIVTNLAQEPAFAEMLMKNDRLMDLKPYFDADPD